MLSCGSGVRLRRLEQGCDRVWSSWRADVIPLLTATGGAALLLGEYHSVPVFISTARAVIDLDSPLVTPNFDVRKHATECLPLVLYIKWAFPANAPVSNANACFVIDDPQPGGEGITFSRSLGAGETRLFHVSVKEDSINGAVSDSLIYRFKTAIRRYAAEARDNHLAPLFRRFSRADL